MSADLAAFAGAASLSPAHPMLPGHFPERPIAPGAWVLAAMLDGLYAATGAAATRPVRLGRTRFLRPLAPGERLDWTWRATGPGRYRGLATGPDGHPVAETDAALDAGTAGPGRPGLAP